MNERSKKYIVGSSTLIGMCIGAGVLGIPYVTSRAGFFVSVFYLLLIGGMVLLLNLYLGETALRTKRNHQLTGYAKKYLGKKAGKVMNFAIIFGGYAAIVAYLVGVGDSVSFLVFGNVNYSLLFGVFFGIFMSVLLWHGTRSLKRYEKYGVLVILFLLSLIFFISSCFLQRVWPVLPLQAREWKGPLRGAPLVSLLAFHTPCQERLLLFGS